MALVVVTAALVTTIGTLANRQIERELHLQLLNHQQRNWSQLVEHWKQDARHWAWALTDDGRLRNLLLQGDNTGISELSSSLFEHTQDHHVVARWDVLDADGRCVASLGAGKPGQPSEPHALTPEALRAASALACEDSVGRPVFAYPVRTSQCKTVGWVVQVCDLVELVHRYSHLIGGEVE
ncbi:MAG: hypothetical protein IT440_14150, partial [Phycisphaeraceae bacterium]|nr:hypothetical protein [Phycisphaeraceae bacterium]